MLLPMLLQVVHNVPPAMTPTELIRQVLNGVVPTISHHVVALPQPSVLKACPALST